MMDHGQPTFQSRVRAQVSRLKRIKPRVAVILAVAGVGLLGAVLTLTSNAATFSAAIEAEAGQKSGNVAAGPTAGASGNASVAFGTVNTGGGGGGGTGGPAGGDGPADPSDCTQTASAKFNWGEPQYQSNFNTATLDPTWHPYGPEPGHDKKGTRTPEQIQMGDGNVTLNSDGKGKTAAMKWFPGQQYGRWEVCMKVKTGEQHYVLLTWPDAENWPQGGELDFAEESGGPNKQTFFLHCASNQNNNCESASVSNDARQWTAYALEWTPTRTIGYVNGKAFLDVPHDGQIKAPMNLCIQLDWFQKQTGPDAMIVDWAKQWPVSASKPSTLGLKPGEPATGQPGDYPDRKPRAMTIQDMRPITQ